MTYISSIIKFRGHLRAKFSITRNVARIASWNNDSTEIQEY